MKLLMMNLKHLKQQDYHVYPQAIQIQIYLVSNFTKLIHSTESEVNGMNNSIEPGKIQLLRKLASYPIGKGTLAAKVVPVVQGTYPTVHV